MGTTPKFAIPYVEPTDIVADYPAAMKAQSDRLELSIALPGGVDGYVSADQTITSTVRQTETPTQVRATIVNPNPSRRMLVHVWCQCWVSIGVAASQIYIDCLAVSGLTTVVPPYGWQQRSQVADAYLSALAEYFAWVPAGGTGVAGMAAARGGGGGTTLIRYSHTSIIPVRFEG